MTKEKSKKEVIQEIPVAPQSQQESLFYIHQLREHSRELFGVKPEVLDGVFKNHTSNQVTKTEAKRLIDSFLKKKVSKKKEGK